MPLTIIDTDILIDAGRRISKRSEGTADGWLGELLSAIGSLEPMPLRCPIAAETRSFLIEIRYLVFGDRAFQYRIIFGVSTDEKSGDGVVTIYRVRNSRQRPLSDSDLFGELDEE